MKIKKMNRNGVGAIGVVLIIMIITMIILGVGSVTVRTTVADKEYNTQIHSHIVNARYSQDPSVIKSELLLAEEAMRDAGLTNETYGALFYWEKTPDNEMRQQYIQLDQAIAMCDLLISMDLNSTSYGSTLTNLQNYIYDDNGWADEVAYDAYLYANYSFVSVWAWIIIGIMIVVFCVLLGFLGFLALAKL